MSFAPRSRSRERNAFQGGVASQPHVPIQREPLHRYGTGVQVPGVSMKGGHMFEGIVIDGRAVTTQLNTKERPANLLRSTSPTTLTRPVVTREDRSIRKHSPLPQTSNLYSQSRSRGSSPTSTNGGGGGTIVPNRTFLEISTKNINNLNRQSSDNASVGSYRSITPSSVSSRSYTSSNGRIKRSDSFSIIENIHQLNQLETKSLTSRRSASPSLLKSLSQTRQSANSPGIHNIQLTQGAYKTVRRSASQDNLLDFMSYHKANTAAEDMGLIMENIGSEGQQYIINLLHSATASPGVRSISEYKTSPLTDTNTIANNNNNTAEIKRIKKLLHLSKMCKDEIDREMVYFTSHNSNNLFFPIENEKSSVVVNAREVLYSIIDNNFIPILNANLVKIKEAENMVLNDNKVEINDLHATINNKEEELLKLVEANNKLKRKISHYIAKYDVLSNTGYLGGGSSGQNEFHSTLLETFGPAFTNNLMEQLNNPSMFEIPGRDSPSLGFPEHHNVEPIYEDNDEQYEVFGLNRHDSAVDIEVPAPPPPPKDRFAFNYDMIEQLANISPQVASKRVVPDPTPPRKFPASPFLQQHVPNTIVQNVLQGYKSPYPKKHPNNISMSTMSAGTSPATGVNSTERERGGTVFTFQENVNYAHVTPPFKAGGNMPHSSGNNSIPNHHVRSQQLYRHSISPTTILTNVNSAAANHSINNSTVSPLLSKRSTSPSYHSNIRQEIMMTPNQEQILLTKVDYRELNNVDAYQAPKVHSPKIFIRSPPKVPIPNFSTSQSNKEVNTFGKSMMEVMLNSNY